MEDIIMPTDVANQIVNHIFGDEKAKAVDAVNDALGASAYDAIQAKKLEFAQQWGFNPDDTGSRLLLMNLLIKQLIHADVTRCGLSRSQTSEDPDPNDNLSDST